MQECLVVLVHGIEVLDQPEEASAVEGLEYRPDRLPAWQRALLVGHDHENLLQQFVHQIIKRWIRARSSLSANVRLEKVVLGLKKPESRPNSCSARWHSS